MHVSLDIPYELAPALVAEGQDPARVALEAWGLEAFRERRLSEYQLRTLLGLESCWDLHALFKERKSRCIPSKNYKRISLPFESSANSKTLTARHDCRGRRRSHSIPGASRSS